MDAATSDTGSRWFVGLGGTPGERCSFVQVVRFDRVLDEGTFVERTRHILPREDAGVL
ncbi:hypothetical protein [Breoghania sp. L-A4]|uniref:hypothetical protein n=1 Tax=Breoghania sp. L-A4 TaxID=2304600 RepID=UPI0013C2C4AE|nr:hypothetical protein [Breoghania sp. L-A4]